MWKSLNAINAQISAAPDQSALDTLSCLSSFLRSGVYCDGYEANDSWRDILSFTPYGTDTLAATRTRHPTLPEPDVHLAMFGMFSYHEIFFDTASTDADKIRTTLEAELQSGSICFPYRFGRLLYDRFNDTHEGKPTNHLQSSDVASLLEDTPVGVYQLGSLVSGPLGILTSRDKRYLPLDSSVPLWHCSDTGCSATHTVNFLPPSVPLIDVYSKLAGTLYDLQGPPSDWHFALRWLHRGNDHDLGRPFVDLPVLLADCVLGPERTCTLASALRSSDGEFLRAVINDRASGRLSTRGSPDEIAGLLTEAEQLQLLLLLEDRKIVSLLDSAIHSGLVRVPVGEVRRARYTPPRRPKDSPSTLSRLGVRSVRHDPLVNLTAAVWRAYETLGLVNELQWRIRGRGSPREDLVAFIGERGPTQAVQDLVLASEAITSALCSDLQVSIAALGDERPLAVDRLLWKLGFNPMQFEDGTSRFNSRLHDFREAVLKAGAIDSEDARESIRSAGVNVGVSVEDFLNQLIAYNVWFLSSDHFLKTKFFYSSEEARKTVGVTLGEDIKSGDATFAWNPTGENALGALLCYLNATMEWVSGLEDTDRTPVERPKDELPHYAPDEVLSFPFRHTAVWADSDLVELRKYADGLKRIVGLVNGSELALVRNGLDHFREPERFPASETLLACGVRISEALELANLGRYIPKTFWLYGRKADRFGSVDYEFRDFQDHSVFVSGPPLVSGLPSKRYETPCAIAPGNILGSPNSLLIFRLREPSQYSNYWKSYPRRRAMSDVTHPPASFGAGLQADTATDLP